MATKAEQDNRQEATAPMGLLQFGPLTKNELDEAVASTPFTEEEVNLLYERFLYLDRSNRGLLTFTELKMLPEFDANPMSPLILNYVEKRYEQMDFASFLEFLGIFSRKTESEDRTKYFFELFDLKGNGKIDRETLVRVQEMMGGRAEDAVERTLEMYDAGKKGYIDYKDFERMYVEEGIDERAVINFDGNSMFISPQDASNHFLPSFLRKLLRRWKMRGVALRAKKAV